MCTFTHKKIYMYSLILTASIWENKSEKIKKAIDGSNRRKSTAVYRVSSTDLCALSAGYCLLLLWQHCSAKSMFTEFTTVGTVLPIKCGLSTAWNLAICYCVRMLFGSAWVDSWHHLYRVLVYFLICFTNYFWCVEVFKNWGLNYKFDSEIWLVECCSTGSLWGSKIYSYSWGCFEISVLRRICGPKREHVRGVCKEISYEDPHNLKSLPEIVKVIKEHEMDVACRTHNRNEKCIQSYGQKTWREKTT